MEKENVKLRVHNVNPKTKNGYTATIEVQTCYSNGSITRRWASQKFPDTKPVIDDVETVKDVLIEFSDTGYPWINDITL